MNLHNTSSTQNIAVIFGGRSPEYGVSLQSAHAVALAMTQTAYTPVLIGISREGDWFYFGGEPGKLLNDTWCNPIDCTPATISPSRSFPGLLLLNVKSTSNRSQQKLFLGKGLNFPQEGSVTSIPLDGAFPVLHGQNGEDGTVQGLLTLAGIPIVGCNVLASALCMDKDRAHKMAAAAGVRVPKSFSLDRHTDEADISAKARELGYPLFVKPARAGSSFGITKASRAEELPEALQLAFSYDDTVLVEECIPGFEVGCAIVGNEELTVGEVDEIELSDGFFDFTEKYTLKTSAIHVPARIPKEQAQKIKKTAQIIYRALGCQGFARVDMFLTPSGQIVLNEVNTIPGFTAHSRFPNMLKACGMSFPEIVALLIKNALDAPHADGRM